MPSDSAEKGITRRRLLSHAARVAATTLAASLLPPNLRRVLADPPRLASLRDIKHVVLVMQENRSFDHYFGTLAGVRGFGDPTALQLSTGRSVFYQPDAQNPEGFLLPFHLDTSKSSAQKIPSTNHSWECQHESWNHGRMDQWLSAHRKVDAAQAPYVMGYYTRADIPFHFALAEAFTVCDAYHSSLMGPTWPNRMYWMTGTIDPEGRHGGPIIANEQVPPGGYTWKTYPERLEAAGISWKVYQPKQTKDWLLNVLGCFKQYREAAPNSPLSTKGLAVTDPDQFESDAMNDRLPAVSWLLPPEKVSEHPDGFPAAGAAWLSSKLNAIAARPEVWAKTAFILNYDENDGIFDHVPPPVPPAGTPQEFVNSLPIGGGFRVPCILVSPWTVGGWVCSQPFDHTSVLQFLEKFTGVQEPNISPWRRQTFGDLTSAFRFNEPKATVPPTLPKTEGRLRHAYYDLETLPPPTLPGSDQTPPLQEPGIRKRVPPTV